MSSWIETRRQILVILGMAGAVAAAFPGCADYDRDPPRGVFLITVDTLRADHLGCYGYPRQVSPFLDSLAEDSVVFQNAFSASSHTAPSHATLLTSLYPAQHNLLRNGEKLADELVTLAEVFQDAGYATAGFTPVRFLNGLGQGFDEFRSGEVYVPAQGVVGWALDWLERRRSSDRVFLWVHLFDVHEWYKDEHLDAAALEFVATQAQLQNRDLEEYLQRAQGLPAGDFPGHRGAIETVDRYDAQLWSVDRQLDRLYQFVHGSAFAEDSLWIITSDHGEGLGNHGFLGHGKYIYNEQLRVPLIVHATDRRYRASLNQSQVELVDLAPTLAEIVGGSFDAQPLPIEGRSLVRLLGDSTTRWEAAAAFAQRRPVDEKRLLEGWAPGDVFAFQESGRKLIVNTTGGTELYDLVHDPFEHVNLADSEPGEIDDVVQELIDRYNQMVEQGKVVGTGEIQPEFVDELKALGYL
jgi:arylsulfatase A-like enzyme